MQWQPDLKLAKPKFALMACVKEERMSGDNDPPLYPTAYNVYHMYCDHCGSFHLEEWIIPENHMTLRKIQFRLRDLSYLFLVVLIFSIFMAFEGHRYYWMIVLMMVIIMTYIRVRIQAKIEKVGMQCSNCGKTYLFGSSFFTDMEANPYHYTLDQIPVPLHQTYKSQTLR